MMFSKLKWVLILLTITTLCGCDDDEDKVGSESDTAAQETDASTTGEDSTSATAEDGTVDDTAGGTCTEPQVYDAPLENCVDCPSAVYTCDDVLPLLTFDRASSTLTVTLSDTSAASWSTAELGGQRFTDGGTTANPFAVNAEGPARTFAFDVSAFEDSDNMQLNRLSMTDSCGQSFDLTFVLNYDPAGTDAVEPYCPLGG